jgi:3-oxoacyl-[acyl-carrier-protein] synthase III
MIATRYKKVCLEAFAVNLPPHEVSSTEIEDRLAPVYERLRIPFGTLEKLSGIKTRYFWDRETRPSQVGTVAAQAAIAKIGFPKSELGAIFSCSVARDYFEPATATLIHRNLGMAEDSIALDISNACAGFSTGITFLANLIEREVVKAGIVVSGETVTPLFENNVRHILGNTELTREQILKVIPTFTLGSGAVAFVLCHESIATTSQRLVGQTLRSATQFNNLCAGLADFAVCDPQAEAPLMMTESSQLILSAASLGKRAWADTSELLGWKRDDVDHIFCHQVGKQVNEAFYEEEGLDMQKEFTIYKKYGNMVSAAAPTCFVLGVEEKLRNGTLKQGDKLLITGFGSGLNAIFSGFEW